MGQRSFNPLIRGFNPCRQSMDDWSLRGCDAQINAVHQPGASIRLQNLDFSLQIVRIVVWNVRHHDDLALLRSAFQHRDKRRL